MRFTYSFKHRLLDYIRFIYHVLTNKRMREHFKRFRTTLNKKPKSVIKDELKQLRDYWCCIPTQYYTHDFYSLDCDLTIEEMKEYIPSYYFYKVIFPQYDNVKAVIPLIENKITMNQLFSRIGLQQSNIVVIKRGEKLTSFNNKDLTSVSIEELFKNLTCNKLFIKPVMGRGGKGIIVAKRTREGYEYNDEKITHDYLQALNGDYVVEAAIEQHPYLNTVYSNSVNTLRAITVRNDNGSVDFIAATLRMGVGGNQVDNSSAGGLLIGIDLNTGMSLKPYATYEFGIEKFEKHPDTGFSFFDLQIPNWEFTKSEIINAAKKLTQLNLVGWDIAITQKEIVIIEANTLFGLDHTQAGIGGMKDFFVNNDPKNLKNIYNFKG
ncbi:hypothetical protein BG00_03040 [Pseudoalteromonas sp. SCSIO_11900]|uniref:sugar-transfer associated ATP-grasp domain-containing protein n=1 Tax=Pseudoalteromonas sp. SCSIO_11900 TaxID=1461766 RepID=UPI000445E139|nr:sugar-transfer associated ATP-grasp domain-containing protein [Pseudoalteromonas sp. SCSIO_11900]EWS97304.1 hypothetical protein BG00_03040 [Pseudoalteromonas sp. SCSIO_11900]